jgi:hypothetical protein
MPYRVVGSVQYELARGYRDSTLFCYPSPFDIPPVPSLPAGKAGDSPETGRPILRRARFRALPIFHHPDPRDQPICFVSLFRLFLELRKQI